MEKSHIYIAHSWSYKAWNGYFAYLTAVEGLKLTFLPWSHAHMYVPYLILLWGTSDYTSERDTYTKKFETKKFPDACTGKRVPSFHLN